MFNDKLRIVFTYSIKAGWNNTFFSLLSIFDTLKKNVPPAFLFNSDMDTSLILKADNPSSYCYTDFPELKGEMVVLQTSDKQIATFNLCWSNTNSKSQQQVTESLLSLLYKLHSFIFQRILKLLLLYRNKSHQIKDVPFFIFL